MIRAPRRLPRILSPAEVDALIAALRTARDRAMVWLMLLGGLHLKTGPGPAACDVHPGERRVFVTGMGGHERVVPIAKVFFNALAGYCATKRPATDTDQVFVVPKGQRPGRGG